MDFLKQVIATVTGIFLSFGILFLIFLMIVGGLISQSKSSNRTPVASKSLLFMDLSHDITEKTEPNPLGDINIPGYPKMKSLGLNDIVARINSAKTDKNIEGIYLNPSVINTGYATLKVIRDALVDFKESGKFIVAFSDTYSQKAYYIASVADSIYLNPKGGLDFRGLSSSVMFMKDALDKLGIDMQVIKVGTYKSAVEPYFLNEMSPENKEQVTSYLNSIYNSFLADISKGRNIHQDSLRAIANDYLIRNPDDAIRLKFVDGLIYKDELINKLKGKLDVAEDKDVSVVSLLSYGGQPTANTAKDKIAVLYAYGTIVDGEGKTGEIGGDNLSRELRKLRRDKDVKAVVLRINSGGGSALASEIIWREVELTKKEKPIVVSMGDYAASGGYYIAAAADSIFAEANTLTGSIGVFGVIPNFKRLMNDKLGIHFDEVSTGKFSTLMADPDRALTAEERAIIQLEVNKVYDTFMTRVADGRKITAAKVDSIGQGRVWSGEQALGLGLVDKIGGLQQAIYAAAAKAELTAYKIDEYPVQEDALMSILSSSKDKVKAWFLADELGACQKYLLDMKLVLKNTGIQARLPYSVEIY